MKHLAKKHYSTQGFSIIEVILAVAIFVIFASGSITVILQGIDSNRLGQEQAIANQFAAEGLEALHSLKNQAYTNLVNTTATGVVRNGSNVWQLSGANNTLAHNTADNYVRVLRIEDVRRDAVPPNGNIIAAGGTVDTDSKKITSTVTWNVTAGRQNSVSLVSYLTDWRKPIVGQALVLYGETTSLAQPKVRYYTNSTNTFTTEGTTGTSFTDTLVGKNFEVKTNPTKVEAVAAYVNNSGVLRVLCFDGSNWSSDWTVTVGGTGTNNRRYNIGYETTTGDVMVVYSTNAANSNEMAYRTKAGSSGCGSANWSGATNIDPVRTSGIVHWIRLEASPVSGSNTIALAWADANSDLSAMAWTGASWAIAEPAAALETNLERASASQDVLSFDVAVESLTGNIMVAWGLFQSAGCTAGTTIATTNCIRYSRYTSSWSAVAAIPTVADPATNMDMSANPATNEIVLAAVDNSQADVSQAYWSGSAWTGKADQDTTAAAAAAGTKLVSTGWLISGGTTRSITVYNDSATTNLGWVVGSGGTFTTQTDFTPAPVFANPQRWYNIQMDPKNRDSLMFTLSDNNSDLFAKRLVMTSAPAFTWSNADGGAAIEANLGQSVSSPFAFAYWRNP